MIQFQQKLKKGFRHLSDRKVFYGWGASVSAFLILASCASIDRTVYLPPDMPGAEFVGTEDCTLCHDLIGENFENSIHARIALHGEDDLNLACESCHGPGSFHSEEGGGSHLIHNPGASPDTCLRCHQSVQGEFNLPHSHPLKEGLVSCIDCHNVHGDGFLETESMSNSAEATSCQKCHTEQSTPHVFEHEALREGCSTCHSVHGSVNPQLLKVRNANLCLQCHFTQQSNDRLMIGEVDHTGFGFIQSGTCWTAGCHEAVHGSQVNGSLRF